MTGGLVSKILPRTLLGQVMLVLAIGLLIAQAFSAFFLYRAAEQRHQDRVANELAFRIINADRRIAQREERRQIREERRAARRAARGEEPRPTRNRDRPRRIKIRKDWNAGIQTSETSTIAATAKRYPAVESDLAELLAQEGIATRTVQITQRRAGDDPFVNRHSRIVERFRGKDWRKQSLAVAAFQRQGRDQWEIVRIPYRRPQAGGLFSILLQTLVIFVVLNAMLFWVLRRITRPLASLTDRLTAFSRNPDQTIALEETGPQDTRRLIAAHNAMEARISSMLDEKDVMLGAIGHDLKTPLAALRVRIESVEDDQQRQRMAQSIEDITHTLDDILSLARIGRSQVETERVDLSALTASIVEEYEDLGEPVTLADSTRLVRDIQVTWIKRALRNLISNALRYGKVARVSLAERDGEAVIAIEDDGPGIPTEKIGDMLEPFQRGEASRNRATGGAGLGLTLARAIVEQHGGKLSLSNREEGGSVQGLRAEIRLPLT